LLFGQPGHDVKGQAPVAVYDYNPRREVSAAREQPVLPYGLWVVGKTVPHDQGAVVYPEPDAVASQDEGGSDRIEAGSASWGLTRLGLPVGAAFGPREVVGTQFRVEGGARCFQSQSQTHEHALSMTHLLLQSNTYGHLRVLAAGNSVFKQEAQL
jgi:hypothetical protein